MAVAILKNGNEDDIQMFMLGFCTDGHLDTGPMPGDPNFLSVTFPALDPGANVPNTKFQQLVADTHCFTSINGLVAGQNLILPDGMGGQVAVPISDVGGVAVKVASADPVFTTLVGVAMDVTLCNGNKFWTRGASNAQIDFPGNVLLYHELVGHALHICNGTFNAADPEGQAIADENVLRTVLALPQRTTHEGGCGSVGGGGGGGGGGCFIATAALGSESAPELQELRSFRDTVIRRTRWGAELFDAFHAYYYAVSPAIAARMRDDPRLAEVVRAIIVQPLIIALRLGLALPKDGDDPAAATAFAARAIAEYEAWIRRLPLEGIAAADPRDLERELTAALEVFAHPRLREAFLANLLEHGAGKQESHG